MRKRFLFSVCNDTNGMLLVITGFISRALPLCITELDIHLPLPARLQYKSCCRTQLLWLNTNHFTCFGVIKANVQVITQAEEFLKFGFWVLSFFLAHGFPGVQYSRAQISVFPFGGALVWVWVLYLTAYFQKVCRNSAHSRLLSPKIRLKSANELKYYQGAKLKVKKIKPKQMPCNEWEIWEAD